MPDRIRYKEGGIGLGVGQQFVVELSTVERARLLGLLFESNKSFLLPGAIPGMKRLVQLVEERRQPKVLITGHTDRVFTAPFNLTLSQERAASMAAFLRDDVEPWFKLYDKNIVEKKRWGDREDQHMLLSLGLFAGPVTGVVDDAQRAAISAFQASKGLDVDGKAGPNTRRALIEAYMQQPGTSLPAGTVLATHGCGESHPEVETDDGVEEPKNRRVEVFLFEGEIDPPPRPICPAGGCPEYPQWKAAAPRTLDLSQPPEKPLILGFGLRVAELGDVVAAGPSPRFAFKEIDAEVDDGDFLIVWHIQGDFKRPLVLTGPRGERFEVDAATPLQEGVRSGSKKLSPGGRPLETPLTFTLTARDLDGKNPSSATTTVTIHDTRWLDRKVFGLGPNDPVPADKRCVYGIDSEPATMDFAKLSTTGRTHGHPIEFVFFELTGFDRFKNPRTAANFKSLRDSAPQMAFGLYHFFGTEDPVVQADNFIDQFQALTGGKSLVGMLPPVLDLEPRHFNPDFPKSKLVIPGPEYLSNARIWLDRVKAALTPAVEPFIYTNNQFWLEFRSRANKAGQTLSKTGFAKSGLWDTDGIPFGHKQMPEKLAAGQKIDLKRGIVGLADGGFDRWTFWQFKLNAAKLDGNDGGVNGNVDLNVFFGNLSDLKQLVVK